MNNELYAIGTVAKMYNLSVQTLRFYERIGLFVPSIKSNDTGYRYYTWSQFERLRTILFMRNLGLPLKEIKQQLSNPRGDEYLKLLEKYSDMLNHRIQSDRELKQYIDTKIDNMKLVNDLPRDKPFFMHFPELKILKYDCEVSTFHDNELTIVDFIRKYSLKSGIIRIGQLFSPQHLTNEDGLIICSGLYVTSDMVNEETLSIAGNNTSVIPAGIYAVMYSQTITEELVPCLSTMLTEIKRNSFEPRGDFSRLIACDVGRNQPEVDGYVACIRILVKKGGEL